MVIWTKELREDHFVTIARGLYHWGPYFVLLGFLVGGMVKIGWLDMPAFAGDVQKFERKLGEVKREVGTLTGKVDEVATRQKMIETEVKNTNRSLEQVLRQLNIIIGSGLNDRPPR